MAVDSSELIIAVEKPSAWGRELTITVPATQVEKERSAAVSRLASRIRMPGFRKGKVPANIIQKKYGQAIEQETLEKVIGEAYREALKREGLQPITQANVDRVDYQAGQDLTFKVALEVRPEIELERIGGFTLKRAVGPVTDDRVTKVIDRLREQQAVWQPIEDGPLQHGDMAMVEITPIEKDDSRGEPQSYRLVIGEGQALPPIEEAILTLKPGEANDFTVHLPENPDNPDSPTEEHRLHIVLSEGRRPELPDADDEFAKSLGDFGSLTDLRAKVRDDLETEANREADREVRSRLIQQIAEANPFDVPSSMLTDYLKQVVPEQDGDDPAKLDEIRRSAAPAATNGIRRMLIVDRIATMESLNATPDDVSRRIDEIAERAGQPQARIRAALAKEGRLDEIENEITEQKVFDYLLSLSTIE
jgi:trigger factor